MSFFKYIRLYELDNFRQFLINNRDQLNKLNDNGETPLLYAIKLAFKENEKLEIIAKMIHLLVNCDINVRVKDSSGRTALSYMLDYFLQSYKFEKPPDRLTKDLDSLFILAEKTYLQDRQDPRILNDVFLNMLINIDRDDDDNDFVLTDPNNIIFLMLSAVYRVYEKYHLTPSINHAMDQEAFDVFILQKMNVAFVDNDFDKLLYYAQQYILTFKFDQTEEFLRIKQQFIDRLNAKAEEYKASGNINRDKIGKIIPLLSERRSRVDGAVFNERISRKESLLEEEQARRKHIDELSRVLESYAEGPAEGYSLPPKVVPTSSPALQGDDSAGRAGPGGKKRVTSKRTRSKRRRKTRR